MTTTQDYKADVLGQFFTPENVVKKMIGLRKNKGSVLEPSAGAGAFISQLEKSAVGIEIDTNIDFDDARIINSDFFDYSVKNKFDTIIGNPPYVRFQDIADSTKQKLPMEMFDKRSNLYLFFIAKCMEHLERKDELIFITPRDFLKATSAKQMNEALYEEGSITFFEDLGDARIFEDASPNCAIWRWEKGRTDRRMRNGGLFHCKNGQIWFGYSSSNETLGDYFDVKVGAVSGADDVYANKNGNVDMVCSQTRKTDDTRKMIYNEKRRCLERHKPRLLGRKIRKFDESNWWEWGRGYHQCSGKRIYVNAKTRTPNPFYESEIEAYDGSVLALFPKKGVDCGKAVRKLNNTDWEKLGFVCDGRMQFTQRSLVNAPFGM